MAGTDHTFEGTMPHPTNDAPYDYTDLVDLYIFRTSDNVAVYSNTFTPTATERANGYWSRVPLTLDAGVKYTARFRHRDSWGAWSAWSVDTTFTVSAGPDPPTLTAPKGKINAVNGYSYQGTHTDPQGDPATRLGIEVWSAAGTSLIYSLDEAIASLPSGSSWSRTAWHADLQWQTSYTWRARLQESSGAWGRWSPLASFRTNNFPNIPTDLLPAEGEATTSRQFSASVLDPDADTITAAQIELVRVSNNQPVYSYNPWAAKTDYPANSDRRPPTANGYRYRAVNAGRSGPNQPTFPTTPNATVKDNAGLSAVARSTAYAVGASVLKPGGTSADAEWYECTTAGTTAATAPAYPTNDGDLVTDGTAVFATRKTITWQNVGTDISRDMTVGPVPPGGGPQTATFTATVGDMVLNEQYKYRIRASDGIGLGWGAWSAYVTFYHQDAPQASLIAPSFARRRNLIRQPSAEYAPASAFWTEVNRTADDRIDRTAAPGAPSGTTYYRGVASATSDNRYRSEKLAVDGAKPVFAMAEMKKESDTLSKTHLTMRCFDNANTLLATLYPSSVALANDTDVTTNWSRYGGIAWPVGSASTPALPAGTTQVEMEVTPSRLSEAVVLFDAVILEQPGLVLSAADWTQAQPWFGYGDGDLTGYGLDLYSWEGTFGDSASSIPAVLKSPSASVVFTYSSSTNSPKKDDRLLIEAWDGTRYVSVYDSGWVASSRTVIPLPVGVVKNEGRYRIRVEVRDSANIVGRSGFAEFDTVYEGPAELTIHIASSDPNTGTLYLQWSPSSLTTLDFSRIEVAREASDEPREIVAVLADQNATSFTYHYPVSKKPYTLLVRQVKNSGGEQIQGRWTQAAVSVDYTGRFFVKSVADPLNYSVAYKVLRSQRPKESRGRKTETVYVRGNLTPIHVLGEERLRSGEVNMFLNDGAGITESVVSRWEKMKQIDKDRPTICILSSEPEEKVFATINDEMEFYLGDGHARHVDFSYEETTFKEAVSVG